MSQWLRVLWRKIRAKWYIWPILGVWEIAKELFFGAAGDYLKRQSGGLMEVLEFLWSKPGIITGTALLLFGIWVFLSTRLEGRQFPIGLPVTDVDKALEVEQSLIKEPKARPGASSVSIDELMLGAHAHKCSKCGWNAIAKEGLKNGYCEILPTQITPVAFIIGVELHIGCLCPNCGTEFEFFHDSP